jgi:hypothetical protein
MQRKIINVYVVCEDNQIKLRFIDMQKLDASTPITALMSLIVFEYEEDLDSVLDDIMSDDFQPFEMLNGVDVALVDHINNLPGNKSDNVEAVRKQLHEIFMFRILLANWIVNSYSLLNPSQILEQYPTFNLQGDNLQDPFHPQHEYAYFDTTITLSADPHAALQLIGVLDQMVHSIIGNGEDHNYQTVFYYPDQHPDFSNTSGILGEAVQQRAPSAQTKLTRYLAQRLVTLAEQHAEVLGDYQNLATICKELLTQESPSLARAIRELIYPAPSMEELLSKYCPDDKLKADVLNPAIPHEQATRQLMLSLKQRLQTMNRSAEPDKDNAPAALSAVMHHWFDSMVITRNLLWKELLNTIFCLPAPDDGGYSPAYTEIELLCQSTMHLNEDGLMVLDIHDTDMYKEYYALHKIHHDKLQHELHRVFHLLGFGLLDNLDFHRQVICNRDTTIELMNRGMHFSEDYFKALMRTSHRLRMFETGSYINQANPFLMLPKNLVTKILHHIEPDLRTWDIQGLSRK